MEERIIIYQVLPRLWKNGKFSDWDSRAFEYVRKLGCSHIWMTGIPRHASGKPFVKGDPGCPYAISDYYDTNPYLADNEEKRISEFKSLIKRAHKAGLKIVTDIVPNHVAVDYADTHGGLPLLDRCDYDWTDTRKIDYGNPRAVDALTDIALWWAGLGVDGFRCDMVELVRPDVFATLTDRVRQKFPDTVFIAEVYRPERYREYIAAGFDLLYDKSGSYDILRGIMDGKQTAEALTWNWQALGDIQPNMLNFLENHDEQRLCKFTGHPGNAFAAMAFSALFNTASLMIYFGQELGESAEESSDGRTSIFNWTKVQSFESPDRRILKRYRELMGLAADRLFTRGGNYDLCWCNNSGDGFDRTRHFAFLRYLDGACKLVVCNFSDTAATVRIRIPEDALALAGLKNRKEESLVLHVKPFDYCTADLTR